MWQRPVRFSVTGRLCFCSRVPQELIEVYMDAQPWVKGHVYNTEFEAQWNTVRLDKQGSASTSILCDS